MQNAICADGIVLNISKKQRPLGCDFIQQTIIAEQPNPNELQAYVLCAPNSRDPGRIYFVTYSKKGKLVECYTVN